jgi:hypothetical protein
VTVSHASQRRLGLTGIAARVICFGSYVSEPVEQEYQRAIVYWSKEAYSNVSVDSVNLKYTVNSCIFGFSNNSTNSSQVIPNTCAGGCGGIQTPLTTNMFQRNASMYQYCLSSNSFLTNSDQCSECLSNQKNETILANCITSRFPPLMI